MPVWDRRYATAEEHPELIKFCQNCTSPDCKRGICEKYKEKYREVWGIQTIKRKRGQRVVNQMFEAFGESHTIKEWAGKSGIPYDALYHRFNSRHWDIEEALTTPTGTRNLITIDGETHTATEWMGICKMPRGSYYKRIREGWSVRDALFTPPPGHKKRREKDD